MKQKFTPQKATGILDLISKIGETAEEQLKHAENEEEYAFIFGHVALANVLCYAIAESNAGINKIQLSFDYSAVHQSYLDSLQECEKEENAQISMEEYFPELFKILDKYFEKKNKKDTTKE